MASTRPPASLATYGVGIVRGHDAGAAARRATLAELCEILTEALGAIFIAHIAPSYRQLAGAVEAGQVGFAWMPPLMVLELEQRAADGAHHLVLDVPEGGLGAVLGQRDGRAQGAERQDGEQRSGGAPHERSRSGATDCSMKSSSTGPRCTAAMLP